MVSLEIPGFADLVEIGRGGMSTVYSARDLGLGRQVALKVLTAGLAADPGFRRRFEQEWKLVASFDHPHIIPVYAAGQVADRMYLAMRLVSGPDLGGLVARDGPLDLARTSVLIGQVAAALDTAHAAGLVHRDVKPRNVLIEQRPPGEHCWLSDFGITKQVGVPDGATLTGAMLLTPHYAAPEQVRGVPVDARTDVYALGCVVYKCLTGHAPFVRGSESGVLAAHLLDAPHPVGSVRPDLPAEIDAVIAMALAKDPDHRYPTAGALADALRRVAVGGGGEHTAPTRHGAAAALRQVSPPTAPNSWSTPRGGADRQRPRHMPVPAPTGVGPRSPGGPPVRTDAGRSPDRRPGEMTPDQPTPEAGVRTLWTRRRTAAAAATAAVVVAAGVVTVNVLGRSDGVGQFVSAGQSARFEGVVEAVAVDSRDNVYFTAVDQHQVFKLDRSGALTLFAGAGIHPGDSGDGGPATTARLNHPQSLTVDDAGNVYIADTHNHRVRKVTPGGVISTVAGTDTSGFSGDGGPATEAQLSGPAGVALDTAGNLYVAEEGNDRVRKVDRAGVITTVAGGGKAGVLGDNGPATKASLKDPLGVAVDGAGDLYIADYTDQRIRVVSNGVIRTFAGTGKAGSAGDDGPARNARLSYPTAIAIDRISGVYIVESDGDRVRKVDRDGIIQTFAGTGVRGFSGDNGPATRAQLARPLAIAVDSTGARYVADGLNSRVRKVDAEGTITTVAGSGAHFPGDDGPATKAQIHPVGVVFDAAGTMYLADYKQHRIRRVSPDGTITTVAGTGVSGFSGDKGPAAKAQVDSPEGVAVDRDGVLHFADTRNNRIRKVDRDGRITTVAGTGKEGFSGDGGPATKAELASPSHLVFDQAGDLYFTDTLNTRVRKVDLPGGRITTVAGTAEDGFSGDNGPAVAARLDLPLGLAFDARGDLYLADKFNHRVRKIDVSTGRITTVAGSGAKGFSGDDGAATKASLNEPEGVAVDRAGNLYIADSGNNRVRRVTPAGVISTVAGSGGADFSGDGAAAVEAELTYPVAVGLDAAGNLYLSDFGNRRIRRIDSKGIISTFAGPA